MQGVEVTLRLNYSANDVLFDLILTSESGEKLATNGSLIHKKESKEAHLKQLEKEYEERVKEEKFSTTYLAVMLKRINRSSTFEEKKVSFIECMTYLYAHKEAIVRYDNFMDIMINKCYEIKEGHPDDGELNGVCDKILTHFELDTDVAVYAKKKEDAVKEQEALREEERKTERAVQKYQEEQKQEQARAVQKDREEHIQLLKKVAKTYDIPFAEKMYEKMYEQYNAWKVTYQGNAKNRYKRVCEFMESLPLFK
jgi:hypothetical protein